MSGPVPTRQPSLSSTLHGSIGIHQNAGPSGDLSPGTSFYAGSGSVKDPYVVDWSIGEKENPYNWSNSYKWTQTAITAINTLCIAFCSSAYSGSSREIVVYFGISTELFIVGISLYVLGFGFGPLVWAPLSEMFGRRAVFIPTYAAFTLFHLGGALGQNIETILISRFFAGFFGAAPLTNSGGIIADIFSAEGQGTATSAFALAPFLGPVLGPIVGGFTAPSSWRNVFWVMFAFAGATFLVSIFFAPETYAPTLLRQKAKSLTEASGGAVIYVSKFDKANTRTLGDAFRINLSRPFVLLFKEPIVLLLSIYISIVYGTLYLLFAAFPIVFQQGRGWSAGLGGLAFIGIGLGLCVGTIGGAVGGQWLYMRATRSSPTGRASPEARLFQAMVGSVLLPIGLFWFAWTSNPHVHWISPVLAGVPFGMGMALVFVSVISYLIDSYQLYAASALASNAILRAILGAVFPLFAKALYTNLGLNWAGTLVGFLSLLCLPMPFLFYTYGPKIRSFSNFASTGLPPDPSLPFPPTVADTDTYALEEADGKPVESGEP